MSGGSTGREIDSVRNVGFFLKSGQVVVDDCRFPGACGSHKEERFSVSDVNIQEELLSDCVHGGNDKLTHLI